MDGEEACELSRIRVLQSFDILDTDEERSFDETTRLLSQVLDVPIALVSLVDKKRQWFKSYVGLPIRETDRDVAFCEAAVRSRELVVIPDATKDPNFAENPLVTGDPKIRFYAGAPLITSEGAVIGTLCVVDTKPRDLSDSDREILEILARQVMDQLELRRVTNRALYEEVDRLRLETRLQSEQKVEGLRILAGGIAHDFNNLLSAILGNANLGRLDLPSSSPLHQNLSRIEVAAERAAGLTRQLLIYSGQPGLENSQVDLSGVVHEMSELLRVSVPPDVAIRFDLGGRATCNGDPTQIRQVLMNILVNGAESMADAEGEITIRTGCVALTDREISSLISWGPIDEGEFAFVEIEDSGVGMEPENQAKMFDPFFSTKKTGRGLGLAAAGGIVQNHSGVLEVDSEIGSGTRIRVYFPYCAEKATLADECRSSRPGNGEVVLVVDDDPNVRRLVATMLESLGFNVRVADDGASGISEYETHQAEIALVLMDVEMPRMSGVRARREILERNPAANMILMSGHVGPEAGGEMPKEDGVRFIQKPFSLDSLLHVVTSALDAVSTED